jgi:hypothetical protein
MQPIKLVAPSADVVVGTETIVIKPFTFGQWPKVIKHIQDALGTKDYSQGVSIPELLAESGESVLELVAIATGKPRSWLDTVEADEGIALVAAVIQVNADTFAKKILPSLEGIGASLTKLSKIA